MKKLLALLIISALMLSSCSLIDKIVNTDPPSDPTEDTTPGSDTMPDDGDTTEPADTSEPDTEPADEHTNVIFAANNYTVVDMGDGTYTYVTDNKKSANLNTVFSDAFIVSYTDTNGVTVERVVLIVSKNGFQTLFSPDDDGYLRGYHTAEKFTQYGNFILAGTTVYDANLVKVFTLPMYPLYYSNNGYEITGISYGKDSIHINTLYDGKKYAFTVWSSLPTVSLPDGAELVAEENTDSGLKAQLHFCEGVYYYTYDYLTVKIGGSPSTKDAVLVYDEFARFVDIDNGELIVTDFNWLFSNSSQSRNHIGYVVMSANLGSIDEIGTLITTHEYHGAKIFSLEPNTYVIKDGEIVHKFDFFRASFDEIGEFLAIGDPPYDPYIVLKPDLTLFSEATFDDFLELGDGNYHAIYAGSGKSVILDADGGIIYESPDDIAVWNIGTATKMNEDGTFTRIGDWALAKFADGTLRMLTPYGEELCNFGPIGEHVYYHSMISGYYEKAGYPYGYYFIIEDQGDRQNGNNHQYEYYYSFETGEYGIIDNGYQEVGAYAKPVLYLYPTEKTDVTVTFEHPERLIVDYPKYDNGWRVTAMPDGTLTDVNGREYYALYWEESSTTPTYDFVDGFCVKGDDSAAFLEEKLAELGFTDKEANEFIIYWLPILEANEYNLIRFELTDEREASSALHISPAPDSLLRVAMHIKALDTPVNIRKQTLPTFERVGFVAVEWGGCIH